MATSCCVLGLRHFSYSLLSYWMYYISTAKACQVKTMVLVKYTLALSNPTDILSNWIISAACRENEDLRNELTDGNTFCLHIESEPDCFQV